MIVFTNTLKRVFRKRINLIFMIFMPVILMAVIMMSSGNSSIRLGVVDNDNSSLSRHIIDSLEGKATIEFIDETTIKKRLLNMTIEGVIVIDKNFEENIIANNEVNLKSYSIQGTNTTLPLKIHLDSLVGSMKTIAYTSSGNKETFFLSFDKYKAGNYTTSFKETGSESIKASTTLDSTGFLVMGILFLAIFAPLIMMDDKQNKTFYRLLAGPITIKKYMFQSILAFFIVGVIQITLLLLILKFLLGAYLGPNPIYLALILTVFSITTVAMGVAICSISKNSKQATLISTVVSTPICMLGGCYWPRAVMPEVLQKISNFAPTTWIMKALEKIIYGQGLNSVTLEMGLLLLFSLIFFLLASWRKAEIVD